MAKSLDLSIIQALAASGAYGGQRALSALSEATVLSAGVWLSNLSNWQGEDFDLTEEEIDEIDEIVADIQYEVSNSMSAEYFERLGEEEYTADEHHITVDDLSPADCRAYKIVITGMLSDTTARWAADMQLNLNGNTVANMYDGYGYMHHSTNQFVTGSSAGGVQGYLLPYSCSGMYDGGMGDRFANMEITIFNPNSEDYKHMQYAGMIGGDDVAKMAQCFGQGVCKITDPITKIELFLLQGTTFLISDSVDEPSVLRATVYGLK